MPPREAKPTPNISPIELIEVSLVVPALTKLATEADVVDAARTVVFVCATSEEYVNGTEASR